MKTLYRRLLKQEQRVKIFQWRSNCYRGAVSCGRGVVNSLPLRLKVFLREHLHVRLLMDYAKARVWIDTSSAMERVVRTKSCAKEPETVAWIEEFLKEDGVFWDIGANVGAYSLIAAKFLNHRVQVYAFEPSFLNYAQLCRNIALNNAGEVIIPLNIALSDHACLETFNYQNFIVGGAMHSITTENESSTAGFKPVFQQKIMSLSIDQVIATFRLPVPQLIKLDVDGVEFKILQGARQTLQDKGVKSILVELDEIKDRAMIDYLLGFGFKVHQRHPQASHDDQLSNYVFMR